MYRIELLRHFERNVITIMLHSNKEKVSEIRWFLACPLR